MKTKSLVLVAMVLLLSACSLKRPTLSQINTAYYGPVPDKREEVVREYLKDKMVHPHHAVIECGEPRKGWVNQLDNISFGWITICSVNAKDPFSISSIDCCAADPVAGEYHFLFQGNKIVQKVWAHQGYID